MTPPESVVRRVAESNIGPTLTAFSVSSAFDLGTAPSGATLEPQKSCCSTPSSNETIRETSCQLTESFVERPSCCQTVDTQAALTGLSKDDDTDSASVDRDPTYVVLSLTSARCQGVDLFWSLLSVVIVDQADRRICKLTPPSLYSLRRFNESMSSIDRSPDAPVPIDIPRGITV